MAQGFVVVLPQRLFDSDGAPAVGWKIYVTNAGMGTPVTTYSTPNLTSANADPVVTDSSGYYRIYLAEAIIVDIEVKNDLGVSQYTLLSVEAMPDTSGSSPSVTAVPTGGIIAWSTATAPTGFLLCNGAAVSRATYSDLNTLLSAASYPFGNGDGSTTFNVPDMRGKFPLGVASSGTGNTLGGTGGLIDHVHTGPAHTHSTTLSLAHTHNVTVAAHQHNVTAPSNGWVGAATAPSVNTRILLGDGATTYTQPTVDNVVASAAGGAINQNTGSTDPGYSATTSSSGTGNTGTANPPFLSLQFIIKT